ncbi:GDP-mannose 4,6-dehydratase, partial [Flavobacterium sp. SaA2.13]|uniref:GDP-mannose 4,6-dehydratase n=1 Tax=Flavobacterium sp. SaA2.13 TaxID=2691898 RepID=UPI00178C7107
MKRKALVTGITGQDGPYLAKLLLEKNYTVYGLLPRRSKQDFYNLDYLNIKNDVEYFVGDVTDY